MGTLTTNDGVRLHYLETGPNRSEAGQQPPLLLLSGGGVAAEVYRDQLQAFGATRRVLALDWRGHGGSEKPPFGYRLARFAKDLDDSLTALNLTDVDVVAHSLGVSVLLYCWHLFGSSRYRRWVLVDEAPALAINPAWSESECRRYGASYPTSDMHRLVSGFQGPGRSETIRGVVDAMTTATVAADKRVFLEQCLSTVPGEYLAPLYYDNLNHDWRDLVAHIRVPTLLIGGRVSLTPWESVEWTHRQLPQSHLRIFEEGEGGGHFPMVENPALFNEVVEGFLAS